MRDVMTENSVISSICDQLNSMEISNHPDFEEIAIYHLQDGNGDTFLHSSIIDGVDRLALYLINNIPSLELLNIRNTLGQTPLHIAVLTQQITVVRRLVVGGANLAIEDHNGNTPLHLACKQGSVLLVKSLLEPIRHIEAKENQYDIPYQGLLQTLEKYNFQGQTSLHLAASLGNTDIMTLLLENGANINSKELKNGRTVLHIAFAKKDRRMIKFLSFFANQIDANAKTYDGYTPYDFLQVPMDEK